MQLGTAIDTRRITLEKGPLAIHLALMVDARGAHYSFWEVRLGGRRIKDGLTERTGEVAEVLRDVVANTTMRTMALDTALRALTWQALDNHEHVPASELRAGDGLHVGGTNYVLVSAAVVDGDVVRVRFEGNTDGVEHHFEPTHLCNLSARNLRP